MKSVILIFWFFAFPCFVINGADVPDYYKEEVKRLDILAESGAKINEALVLTKNGFLGDSSTAFVYEGVILADNNRSVAIKFVPNVHSKDCEREIEMFFYLKAYKNESVEKYGIPVVYYYDRWEDHILIALTKFDQDLRDIYNQNSGLNQLDILMLFRDFVFQSKYIHGHGVRHDDIKPDNIMIRGHRSFLIDFNMSSKLMEDNRCGSKEYVCKRFLSGATRRAVDDWECFLYTMCAVLQTNWFGRKLDNKKRKENIDTGVKYLDKVIKAFANEVFTGDDSKTFPDYNKLEKLISGVIAKNFPNDPPKFSWVAATAEVNPVRNINDIPDPKSIAFDRYVYPHVERLPPLEQ